MRIANSRENAVPFPSFEAALSDSVCMTKKYVTYPVQRIDRAGNVVRGFVVGLAEFGCLGTRLYDLSGYPHESESDAIYSDWQSVGADMWNAIDGGVPDGTNEKSRKSSVAKRSGRRVKRGSRK